MLAKRLALLMAVLGLVTSLTLGQNSEAFIDQEKRKHAYDENKFLGYQVRTDGKLAEGFYKKSVSTGGYEILAFWQKPGTNSLKPDDTLVFIKPHIPDETDDCLKIVIKPLMAGQYFQVDCLLKDDDSIRWTPGNIMLNENAPYRIDPDKLGIISYLCDSHERIYVPPFMEISNDSSRLKKNREYELILRAGVSDLVGYHYYLKCPSEGQMDSAEVVEDIGYGNFFRISLSFKTRGKYYIEFYPILKNSSADNDYSIDFHLLIP